MRMELGLSQQQTLKQIQTLSPQMYMSMEILCLNSLDLEQRVATELENNETLERDEPAVEKTTEPAAETAESSTADDDKSFEERFEQWDEYSREEYAISRGRSSYRGDKDEKYEALSNTEDRPISLQEHLEQQVNLLGDDELLRIAAGPLLVGGDEGDSGNGTAPSATEASLAKPIAKPMASGNGSEADGNAVAEAPGNADLLRELCEAIIYNVNGRGYLMYALGEIRDSLRKTVPAPLEAFQRALVIVQSLDPPGIGGRDLKECLMLQLRRDPQDYPLEERIISGHLDDLGHNRLPKIARVLGVNVEDIKEAMQNIGSLNPLPGKLYGSEMTRYVKPDVVVEDVEGRYEVRVESDYLPRLHISPHYRELYKQSRRDPEVKKYLKKKMDNAEWLLAAIRQRQSTLQKIAQEIVDIQHGFLDHGISHLKPLKMADVAERVGVHVSTISRAISGKYVQTPRGIYDLKFFFTGGSTKADGNVEARGSVIQRIKNLIAQEDSNNPLSDISIVKKLAESGINISRRTVTKYREAEQIPSSRERKSY